MNEFPPDTTLLEHLDEVRRKTLRRLEGVSEEQARWTPEGLQNHILWHAGHLCVVLEWLTMESIGAEPVSPEGWFEMFSWNSKPGEVPDDQWPTLEDVVSELRLQHGRLRNTIQNLNPEILDHPSRNQPNNTVRVRILHALIDEANHAGEIWLLRKLQGIK